MDVSVNSKDLSPVVSAQSDIGRTLRMWRLWMFMAWEDVRQRYRGSFLGPLWLAGSVAVITVGAGSLYASLFGERVSVLLPYISVSIALWLFISLTLAEGCAAFISSGQIIRNTPLPIALHVFRTIARNLFVLAHSAPVILAVFLIFQRTPTAAALLAIPGFLLLALNVVWMTWIAALIATRFRDAGQIIIYLLQFAIFVTPIFWLPEQAGERHLVLVLNPFHHLLEVVRRPLLGGLPGVENWAIASVMGAVGLAVTVFVHTRVRARVVHWI